MRIYVSYLDWGLGPIPNPQDHHRIIFILFNINKL